MFLDNDFVEVIRLMDQVNILYHKKEFCSAIYLLDNSLGDLRLNSESVLSSVFDMVASILWKMGNRDEAMTFWKEAIKVDMNNRHAFLALSMFYNKKQYVDNKYELFVKTKLNEFIFSHMEDEQIALRKDIYREYSDLINEELYNILIKKIKYAWDSKVRVNDIDDLSENELVEYYMSVNCFK